MDTEKTLRIRTKVAAGNSFNVNVNLNQTYSSFDILSLKIKQDDAYRYQSSDYGVVVGRVLANNGFGVPNAKLSLFISVSDDISDVQALIYPFKNITSKNSDGIRYNLLPSEAVNECHKAVGSFPSKTLVLDDKNVLEVYDTYYKFTTVTNNSGDYMIFGVPVGSYTLHMDLDLSDCGTLSQRPRDFLNKGYTIDQFENANQFKSSTELDSLTQIITQNETVDVVSFWGDENSGNEIGITRKDINVNYKFEPTCVFMGSMISDQESQGFTKKCKPTEDMGLMSEMTTGAGTIEMIRKTINNTVESFQIKGNELINGNGVWCYQIPMNLDYVATDEYGNLVPTDDVENGIPTRACVRFRLSYNGDAGVTPSYQRGKVLVPHNPKTEAEIDYNFGSMTQDSSYKDLFMNNVYSVKSYIPRIQKKQRRRQLYRRPSSSFSGIKECNFASSQNPFPYNNIRIRIPFSFRISCTIIKMTIRMIKRANRFKRWFAFGGHYSYLTDEMCPDLEGWFFAPGMKKKVSRKFQRRLICRTYLDIYREYYRIDEADEDNYSAQEGGDNKDDKKDGQDGEDIDSLGGSSKDNNENDNDDSNNNLSNKYIVLTTNCNYLIQCAEMNLAMEHKLIKFDFFNDWVNGTIYLPRFSRTKSKRKRFKHWKIKTIYVEKGCFTSVLKSSTARYIFQTCALAYNPNATNNMHTDVSGTRVGCWKKKRACHASLVKRRIFGKYRGGLVRRTETLAGQTVYYLKPAEWWDGKQVLLFATDIILLGSLDDCDKNGIPKIFSSLESTTYKMPENLVTTNLDDNAFLYYLEGGVNVAKIRDNESKLRDRKVKWLIDRTTPCEDLFPLYYNDPNRTVPFNTEGVNALNGNEITLDKYKEWVETQNNEDASDGEGSSLNNSNKELALEDGLDDSYLLTEAAGIDWTMNGPGQGSDNTDNLYNPGGHFLAITCKKANTNVKSCINLQRVCEAGVSFSERNSIPTGINPSNSKLISLETIPTGLIAYDEIFDKDFRSEFATLNHNGLKTEINKNTGLKEYKLNYICPDGFDGELSSKVNNGTWNFSGDKVNVSFNANSEEGEYEEDFYLVSRALESPNQDYHRFRFGMGKSETDDTSHFLIQAGNTCYFPVYQNSFYFYFGLINGSSALDEFRKLYFADCGNYDYSVEDPYIELETHDDELAINVILHNLSLPVSALTVTKNSIVVFSDLEDTENHYYDSKLVSGLTIGRYVVTVTDNVGDVYEAEALLGYNLITIVSGFYNLLDYNTISICINSYDFNINKIPETDSGVFDAFPTSERYSAELIETAENKDKTLGITCDNTRYGGIITLPAVVEYNLTSLSLDSTCDDTHFYYTIECGTSRKCYSGDGHSVVEYGIVYEDLDDNVLGTLIVPAWAIGNYDIYINILVNGEESKIFLTRVFIDKTNRDFDFYINDCEYLSYDDTLKYLPALWWAENNENLDSSKNVWNGISDERMTDCLLQRNLIVEKGSNTVINFNTVVTNDIIQAENICSYTIGPEVVKYEGDYMFRNPYNVVSETIMQKELSDETLSDYEQTTISLSSGKFLPTYYKDPPNKATIYSSPYWYTQYNKEITSDESFQCATNFIGTLGIATDVNTYILEPAYDAKLTYRLELPTPQNNSYEKTYSFYIFSRYTAGIGTYFDNIFTRHDCYSLNIGGIAYKASLTVSQTKTMPMLKVELTTVRGSDDTSLYGEISLNNDNSFYVDVYIEYCDNFLAFANNLFKNNKELYKVYIYSLTSFEQNVFTGSGLKYLFYYSELYPSFSDASFSGVTSGGTVGPEDSDIAMLLLDSKGLSENQWGISGDVNTVRDLAIKADVASTSKVSPRRKSKATAEGETTSEMVADRDEIMESSLDSAKELRKEYVMIINKNIPLSKGVKEITDDYLYYGYISTIDDKQYVTIENPDKLEEQENPQLFVYKMASIPLYDSTKDLFLKGVCVSYSIGSDRENYIVFEGDGTYNFYKKDGTLKKGQESMLIRVLDDNTYSESSLGLKGNDKSLIVANGNVLSGKTVELTYGDFIIRNSSDTSKDDGEYYTADSIKANGLNVQNQFLSKKIKFTVPSNDVDLEICAFERCSLSEESSNFQKFNIQATGSGSFLKNSDVYMFCDGVDLFYKYISDAAKPGATNDIFIDCSSGNSSTRYFRYGNNFRAPQNTLKLDNKLSLVDNGGTVKINDWRNYYYYMDEAKFTQIPSTGTFIPEDGKEYAVRDDYNTLRKIKDTEKTDTTFLTVNALYSADLYSAYKKINNYSDLQNYSYVYYCVEDENENPTYYIKDPDDVQEYVFLSGEDTTICGGGFDAGSLLCYNGITDDFSQIFITDMSKNISKYYLNPDNEDTYSYKFAEKYAGLTANLVRSASMFFATETLNKDGISLDVKGTNLDGPMYIIANTSDSGVSYSDVSFLNTDNLGHIRMPFHGIASPSADGLNENPLNRVYPDGIAFFVQTEDFGYLYGGSETTLNSSTFRSYMSSVNNTIHDIDNNHLSTIYFYFKFSKPEIIETKSSKQCQDFAQKHKVEDKYYNKINYCDYYYYDSGFCKVYATYDASSFKEPGKFRRETLVTALTFTEFAIMFTDFSGKKDKYATECTNYVERVAWPSSHDSNKVTDYRDSDSGGTEMLEKYDIYNVLYVALQNIQGTNCCRYTYNNTINPWAKVFRIIMRNESETNIMFPDASCINHLHFFEERSGDAITGPHIYSACTKVLNVKDFTYYGIYNEKEKKLGDLHARGEKPSADWEPDRNGKFPLTEDKNKAQAFFYSEIKNPSGDGINIDTTYDSDYLYFYPNLQFIDAPAGYDDYYRVRIHYLFESGNISLINNREYLWENYREFFEKEAISGETITNFKEFDEISYIKFCVVIVMAYRTKNTSSSNNRCYIASGSCEKYVTVSACTKDGEAEKVWLEKAPSYTAKTMDIKLDEKCSFPEINFASSLHIEFDDDTGFQHINDAYLVTNWGVPYGVRDDQYIIDVIRTGEYENYGTSGLFNVTTQ